MNHTLDIQFFNFTFAMYFLGFLAFALFAASRRTLWHRAGAFLMTLGLLFHTVSFFTRWQAARHVPLSNMYEYLSVMSWGATAALLYVYIKYRRPIIGSLVSPAAFMLAVAAALLPKDINQSLMPALQSIWLYIHVSMAALGSGCFLVAFAASILFLTRQFFPEQMQTASLRAYHRFLAVRAAILPIGVSSALGIVGVIPPAPESGIDLYQWTINLGGYFILLGLASQGGIISAWLIKPSKIKSAAGYGGLVLAAGVLAFLLGSLIVGILIKAGILRVTGYLPSPTGESVKSGWMIFEFIGASYLAGLILFPMVRLLLMRTNRAEIFKSLNPDFWDEVSYKTVTLGYPLYTVGALFAGAVWAEQAWGAFWSWDPKEVGALIVWLFFSGYLHARLQRGWSGTKAAVLVIGGFLVVLLSFFGNYFFGGMHAYG